MGHVVAPSLFLYLFYFFLFPSSFRLFDCHETRRIFMQFNMFEWTEDQNSPTPPPPKNPQKQTKKKKKDSNVQTSHLFFYFTGGTWKPPLMGGTRFSFGTHPTSFKVF
jgi:hypothetical protein